MSKLTDAFKKAGSAASKAGKAAYKFGQRVEFAPEDRVQRGEYLFGLRKEITAKPPKKTGKKKTTSKVKKKGYTGPKPKKTFTKYKTVQQDKTPTIKTPVVKPPAPKTDAYVKVGKKFGSMKRIPVTYKAVGATKYNREWFNTIAEAEQYARSVAGSYGVKVTYE